MPPDVKESAPIILKPCPFCGAKAVHDITLDRGSSDGYVLSSDSHCIICVKCHAQSAKLRQAPLCEFAPHTVAQYRANPILRARVEDEYEQYIEKLRRDVAQLWNTRHLYAPLEES